MSKEVSVEDRARIAALLDVVADVENKIAAILGPYMSFKKARITHDHHHHKAHPSSGGGTTEALKLSPAPKRLIAVVDTEGNEGHYGCYYDPPGICEPCE